MVLRVPVLYGSVVNLKESAVATLLETLLTPDKPTKVSDWEWRCPSHVDDIAVICHQLLNACKVNWLSGGPACLVSSGKRKDKQLN